MNDKIKMVAEHKDLIKSLYEYAKEALGFEEEAKIVFLDNEKNAMNPLGRTAYYDPEQMKVSIYITGRHIKDVLRSTFHELVHHSQNCRGLLKGHSTTEGYMQTNEHLREMEKEAYMVGNLMMRDWEQIMKDKIK